MNNKVELKIKVYLDQMMQQFIEARKNNNDEKLTDENVLESIFDRFIIIQEDANDKESAQYALNIFKKLIYINSLSNPTCDSKKFLNGLGETLFTEENKAKFYITKLVNEGIQHMATVAPQYKINGANCIEGVKELTEYTISSFFRLNSIHSHTITLKRSTDNPNLDQMLKEHSDYLDGLADYISYEKLFDSAEKLQAIKENYSGDLYTLEQLYTRRIDNVCLMEHGLKLCRDMERGIRDDFIEEELKLIASVVAHAKEIKKERDAFYEILGTLWCMTNNSISIEKVNTDGSNVLDIDDSLEGFMDYQKNLSLVIDGKINELREENPKITNSIIEIYKKHENCLQSSFSNEREFYVAKQKLENAHKAEIDRQKLLIRKIDELRQERSKLRASSLKYIYMQIYPYQRDYIIEKIEEHAELQNMQTKVRKTFTKKKLMYYTLVFVFSIIIGSCISLLLRSLIRQFLSGRYSQTV
ncbi:hypothetical protein NEMIN01_0762 [Nematocida minor]|uniref:uncharacterized protein n=1 Tax=Nematocida minor TaxID=1912983 RepID=UPI00221F66EC|nr:uncharacterized protein NEMIN01_0762 [Nematocida minor]KAI5189899.1 hypothetical protein NEMIN01_0762 [Nematocida minor]